MAKKRKSKSDERAKLYTTAPAGADESAADRVTRKTIAAMLGDDTTTGTPNWDKLHSALQSKNASQPRPTAFWDVVDMFVAETEGNGTERELLIYLENQWHDGDPIQEVTDDEIWWTDGKGRSKKTSITALRGTLSRAKERYRSR